MPGRTAAALVAILFKLTAKMFDYFTDALIEEKGADDRLRREICERLGKKSREQWAIQRALNDLTGGWLRSPPARQCRLPRPPKSE